MDSVNLHIYQSVPYNHPHKYDRVPLLTNIMALLESIIRLVIPKSTKRLGNDKYKFRMYCTLPVPQMTIVAIGYVNFFIKNFV